MVHNGIEYGDMQILCESYHLMKDVLKMSHDEMGDIMETWNKGELDCFLVEITRDILRFKDDDGKPLVEKIRDTAGQVCCCRRSIVHNYHLATFNLFNLFVERNW